MRIIQILQDYYNDLKKENVSINDYPGVSKFMSDLKGSTKTPRKVAVIRDQYNPPYPNPSAHSFCFKMVSNIFSSKYLYGVWWL